MPVYATISPFFGPMFRIKKSSPYSKTSALVRGMRLSLRGWIPNSPQVVSRLVKPNCSPLPRVFVKDPGLVILDEPSSRLDPATEQNINFAVEHLLQNRTGIIIAHRLETVERVDNILILDDGQVREFGLRTELVADPNSQFARLLNTGLEELIA